LCVVPACDQNVGVCAYNEKNCDDGNPCTTDSCDPTTGNCINTLKSCTCPAGHTGSCNVTSGQCQYYPACRTSSDCTNGGNCDPSRGCVIASE